jgi:hypothetical protein
VTEFSVEPEPPRRGRKIAGIVGVIATLVGSVVIVVILALGTCNKGPPEYSGIGKYRFGHTEMKDIKDGLCQPTDIEDGRRKATWCFGMPGVAVGSRAAEIHLYFDGTEPDGDLIEIQLKIRGCNEQELESWMRQAFGPPVDQRANRMYWQNSFLWAAALMPSEPARCLVHLLPHSEAAEIARIKAK